MYTKKAFGNELEQKLQEEFDVVSIARWAHEKYLLHISDIDKELSKIIMAVVAMEEGPEFEYTKEELLTMAKNLREGNFN